MRRLYKLVSISEKNEHYTLLLDGKPVKTPDGHALQAPNKNIADILLQEWAAQETEILPASMPFTQFLSTKFDRVIPQRVEITAQILKYLDTDLVCYRTDHPPVLEELQKADWDPWVKWFENHFGESLLTTTALTALKQSARTNGAVAEYVGTLDHDAFNILQFVTSVSGSLILALAFVKGAIEPQVLFQAMRVEEIYKGKIYGEAVYGPESLQEKRDLSIQKDLRAAAKYLKKLTN